MVAKIGDGGERGVNNGLNQLSTKENRIFTIMRKYFLVSFIFIVLLFALFAVHINDWAFFVDGVGLISLFGVPFLLFALITYGMGHVLQNRSSHDKVVFRKPLFRLQLILSIIYLAFMIINFNLLSLTNYNSYDDCYESNMITLSGVSEIDDTISKCNAMAYKALINILSKEGKRPSDTNVCITAVEYIPVDTVINTISMKSKVTLTLTIPKRTDEYYRFMFYCNDSIGFPVNRHPVAVLD